MQKAAEAAFFLMFCDAYASCRPLRRGNSSWRYITAAIASTTASMLRLFSAATQMRPVLTA